MCVFIDLPEKKYYLYLTYDADGLVLKLLEMKLSALQCASRIDRYHFGHAKNNLS